jgi:predicted ATPase
MTVRCVAIAGYRSLHDLCFAPGPLTVISGGNGVGKSNVYRALEMMHAAAQGRLARTLANEGGIPSAAWAGPEEVRTEAAKRRGQAIEPTVRRKPLRIRLGMQLDAGCFEMTLGLPPPASPPPTPSAFHFDPEVKEEWLWTAPPRRKNKPFLTREGLAAHGLDSDGRLRTYTPLDPGESVLGRDRRRRRAPRLRETGPRRSMGKRQEIEPGRPAAGLRSNPWSSEAEESSTIDERGE